MASNYTSDLFTAVTQTLGAPKLIPRSNTQNVEPFPQTVSSTVDVHKDYTWTLSGPDARSTVPTIHLTEYKLNVSSEVSGFLYTLRGEANNLNVLKKELPTSVNNVGNLATTQLGGGKLLNAINSAIQSATKTSLGDPSTPANVNNSVSQTTQDGDVGLSIPGMDVYKGLYSLEETGWNYSMPYFGSSSMLNPNNTWGEGNAIKDALTKMVGGAGKMGNKSSNANGSNNTTEGNNESLGGLFDMYKGIRDTALSLGGGTVLREKPQSFTGTGSDSIQVSFYLLNTLNPKDIKRNWEFCYLFNYQNLANRKGINLLDPPCMYKAYIPGYKQLPICWITNLNITNIGATRMINITSGDPAVNGEESPAIKMIPEAYKVEFTLESALKNARNLFQYVADPSAKVTVNA